MPNTSTLAGGPIAASTHPSLPTDRVAYLDGWRGLAIGLVLISHFLPRTPWFNSGLLGVDIFFCLSGLLMSRLLFVRRMDLKTFYKRRASRILPVFFLFVGVVFAIHWVKTGRLDSIELIPTALFLRTYVPAVPDIWHSPLPIGHLWSLNVEEHCYVLMGLLTLAAWLRGREWLVLVGAGLLTIVIYIAYVKLPGLVPPWGDAGTEVVAGPLLLSAGYALVSSRLAPFVRPWMPVAAFAAATLCFTSLLPRWSIVLVAPFFLAFAVNHLDVSSQIVRTVLSWPPLRLLGVWSFSIYIWQQPIHQAQALFPFGSGLFAAMAIGVLSFSMFESPVREWLNRNW